MTRGREGGWKVGGRTSIVGIFLLTHTLDRAVERAEQTAPDAKVATEDRRACFDSCKSTDASFAVGTVAEAFYTVPEGTADGLERKVALDLFVSIFTFRKGDHVDSFG